MSQIRVVLSIPVSILLFIRCDMSPFPDELAEMFDSANMSYAAVFMQQSACTHPTAVAFAALLLHSVRSRVRPQAAAPEMLPFGSSARAWPSPDIESGDAVSPLYEARTRRAVSMEAGVACLGRFFPPTSDPHVLTLRSTVVELATSYKQPWHQNSHRRVTAHNSFRQDKCADQHHGCGFACSRFVDCRLGAAGRAASCGTGTRVNPCAVPLASGSSPRVESFATSASHPRHLCTRG